MSGDQESEEEEEDEEKEKGGKQKMPEVVHLPINYNVLF